MPSHEDCIDSTRLRSRGELDSHRFGRSVMPSHEDCVDSSLDLCSDLLPDPSKCSLLSRPNIFYSVDSSSSEDDDSADLSLKPKKDDKNWNEVNSDDSDFEIIDVRELDNVGNV